MKPFPKGLRDQRVSVSLLTVGLNPNSNDITHWPAGLDGTWLPIWLAMVMSGYSLRQLLGEATG